MGIAGFNSFYSIKSKECTDEYCDYVERFDWALMSLAITHGDTDYWLLNNESEESLYICEMLRK